MCIALGDSRSTKLYIGTAPTKLLFEPCSVRSHGSGLSLLRLGLPVSNSDLVYPICVLGRSVARILLDCEISAVALSWDQLGSNAASIDQLNQA